MTTAPLLSWLFFIFFYSATIFAAIVSGQCLGDQQSLLLQLKDSLIFKETTSTILVKWNQSSDCCGWEGITCDEEGRVTGLKLRLESISGGIDDKSTLFNLKYLKSLDLSLNWHLKSAIPSRIGNLTNLSYLNLAGSFSGQVPKEMSSLTKLLILDLSDLLFTTEDSESDFAFIRRVLVCQNLSMLVHNLSQLEELYLDGVNISAKDGNEWGKALSSSLPNLRVLSMASCYLYGPIPQSLVKLKFLSVILLYGNYELSSPFPTFFGNFSNLTSLWLGECGLYGTFSRKIFQIPTLRILDISMNSHLQGSLPEFHSNSFLQVLDIRHTNFGGRLPYSLGNLRQLTHLDLSNCPHFSGSLPYSLANLTHLVYLDLSANQFVGPIPSFNECGKLTKIHIYGNQLSGPIPSFSECRNLTEIDLSDNQLSGPIPSDYFEGLPNLIQISLRNNSFDGKIPSSLFALPSLTLIDLSDNKFSQLVEFLSTPLSMLEVIDLSRNNLQGPIPLSIYKLRALSRLSLCFNKFNGTIHLNIFRGLRYLYDLDLSYNNLSVNVSGNGSNTSFLPMLLELRLASCNLRRFPDIFKNQRRQLYDLDLSYNKIDGEIPNWIWNISTISLISLNLSNNHLLGIQEPYSLSSVLSLDLSFNKLHRVIPMLPPNIYYVDLSSNSFTSSIPSNIGDGASGVSYFSLANNSLTGVIPDSMCNVRFEILDLSHNSLSGMVPACLFAFNQTAVINLQKNNLSGPVPDIFPVDCSLMILDLRGNLLSERIPKSLANCRALENLDLGNNRIVDKFPKFLKYMSILRVLVLKSNKFYGQITCTESIGDWPMIQVVDVASNSFSGELPGQCLTKWHMMTVKGYGQRRPTTVGNFTNYKAAVLVTNKGLDIEMPNVVPNGFTYIDFSSNRFHGEIPKELGQLISLLELNLSNNFLSGHIPFTFGDMRQLESLDLSRNHLSGNIPPSLSNLNFLEFLNLSYNQLHGRIPSGSQIQTFSADGFQGNQGLCGLPLTPNCPGDKLPETPNNKGNHSTSAGNNKEIEWNLISVEIGFIVGFGGVVGPLVFWRRWRKKYFDRVEDIAYRILPQALLKEWLTWKMGSTTRRRGRVSGRRARN